MRVRHQREVGPVPGLEEQRHQRHQPEHQRLLLRVEQANEDQQRPGDDAHDVDQRLLAPQVLGASVDQVRRDAAERPEEDVEQPEHGGPPPRPRLPQVREVLEVVRAQDAVDGQLGAEGVEVAEGQREGLEGAGHGERVLEGRLDDDLAARRLDHVGGRHGSLVVVVVLGGRDGAFFLQLLIGRRGDAGGGGRVLAVRDGAGDGDDAGGADAVRLQALLGVQVAVGPSTRRGVGAEDDHRDGRRRDDDEGHDEGDTPGDVGREAAGVDKRVEDGGHEEVGDAAAGVAPAASEGVGGADDVLVEEARRPDLAGHEGAAEDADEEADRVEPRDAGDGAGEGGGDGAHEEAAGEGEAGTD